MDPTRNELWRFKSTGKSKQYEIKPSVGKGETKFISLEGEVCACVCGGGGGLRRRWERTELGCRSRRMRPAIRRRSLQWPGGRRAGGRFPDWRQPTSTTDGRRGPHFRSADAEAQVDAAAGAAFGSRPRKRHVQSETSFRVRTVHLCDPFYGAI